jgi:hypothetical protein
MCPPPTVSPWASTPCPPPPHTHTCTQAGMKLRWVRDINVTIAAEAAPPAAVTARQPRFSQVVIAQDAAAPKICGVRSDAAAAGRLTCVCYACTCRRDIGDLLPKVGVCLTTVGCVCISIECCLWVCICICWWLQVHSVLDGRRR